MTCYRPLVAFKPLDGGPVSFSEKKNSREIQLSCGQCIGCRIKKREDWAIRCYCESKLYPRNSFVTLTYDDEHLPSDGSLNYEHFQLFMKRLRKRVGKLRFFMCGEYGENTDRPHYHALLFGYRPDDLVRANSVYSADPIYDSPAVRETWGKGHISIGDVTYASARYCAVYATKKITGDMARDHYARLNYATGEITELQPEFAHMSLRPGIGAEWLKKFYPDLYLSGADAVVIDGQRRSIPRYFHSAMENIAPLVLDDHQFKMYMEATKHPENNTAERLQVREAVTLAKHSKYKEIPHAL